jgi:segregation and condensation protein A
MSEAYTVKLEHFEGPLDLLLHLIKKHEVDLYNIRVAEVTDQYLAYLVAAKDLNLDIAGEFLVMAATLIYLKSRALLPPDEREEIEEEELLDPEAELVQQLLEHERFQRVAQALASRPVLGRDVFSRTVAERVPGEFTEAPKPVTVAVLLNALERVIARRASAIVHQIRTESLTIRDGLAIVCGYLRVSPRATFDELFPESASRMRIIVIFLAILELIKFGAISVQQLETYGEIEIVLLREVEPGELLTVEHDGEGAEA